MIGQGGNLFEIKRVGLISYMEEVLCCEGSGDELPRDGVCALFLEVFRVRLERDLSNLVEQKVVLHMEGSLKLEDL